MNRNRPSTVPALFTMVVSACATAIMPGCGRYVPALFADRPVVTQVHDDQPIDVPARRGFDEREQISDIYLRRPLFEVVRAVDFPTAGDVNAMDEVPASSWYDPAQPARFPSDVVPPTLPMVAIAESPVIADDALVVKDARGTRYELLSDPPENNGLITGAEVLAGYLLRSVGLRAPRSWVLSLPESGISSDGAKSATERLTKWLARKAATAEGGRRVSATLWSGGVDVGVAGDYAKRSDDPNDRVPHADRRTLRAMKVFAQWIGWSQFSVKSTRDVYVGRGGEGHLVHYFVGLSRALGTQALHPEDTVDETGGSLGFNLITLGLAPPTITKARVGPFPSVGWLPKDIDAGDFDVSPPYSPFVRFTPADEYWAAKRLMDAPDEALKAGIAAAFVQTEAGRHLTDVLTHRRRLLIAHAMAVVTPLDVATNVGREVWVRDRGIVAGEEKVSETEYEIAFLDHDGTARAPRKRIRAAGELTSIPIPKALLFGLVVLRVRALRAGVAAPRSCDIHVRADRASARVIGVRH